MFKEEVFVRKHILNKHAEKAESAKQEAEFFNSYLADTARPRRTPSNHPGAPLPSSALALHPELAFPPHAANTNTFSLLCSFVSLQIKAAARCLAMHGRLQWAGDPRSSLRRT